MTRTQPLPVLLAVALASGFLSSCTRPEDPGIKEKIALLEAELRDRDEQLATRQEEANSQTAPAAEPAASMPDLDKAKGGYLAFVEELRQKLARALPAAKFDRTSVFPVEGPDPSKPIISRVAFRIASADGRSGEMVVPLFADPAGRWQEPQTAEIIANFKAKLAAPAVVSNTPAPQPAAPAPAKPLVGPEADKTIKIDWNDGPKQGQKPPTPNPQPPLPQAPVQPQSPALPKKVMPTSRDVIIDFE
jgi:hypothetical protein